MFRRRLRRLRATLLGLCLGAAFAVSAVLGVAAARMPTSDDLALARFVAVGGTAGDLCGTTRHPHGLLDELMHLCQPAAAPALLPVAGGLPALPLRLARLGRRTVAAALPVRRVAWLPEARGPPAAA